MKQADEVVASFGARRGGTNARSKPLSAINDSAITTAIPGSQLARLANRRCWLHARALSATEDLVFTKDSIECHGDPGSFLLPEILVVPLTEPLVQYGESSRDDPQRPAPSVASCAFGCDADRERVHGLCQQRCNKMVAAVPQDAVLNDHGSDSVKRSWCQHYQYKTTCETLLRLVDASLTPAELEANASPSAKFVIGNELVQPTSSDEIVKARCSCGWIKHVQSGSRRIAGVCITAPLRPTLFFRGGGGGDHSLLGACHKGAATHLLHVAALPDHRG